MHENDGPPTLEIVEDRLQCRVAEVHAVGVRKQNDPIEPEDVEYVRQLLERRVDLRLRKASEAAKPVGPPLNEVRRKLIASPR